MSIFVGFFPDDEIKTKIATVVVGVKDVFKDLGINVRWSEAGKYHVTLLFLSADTSPIKLLYYKFLLKKFSFKKFKIRFNSIKLGLSRKFRQLIYLDLLEGGEEMRGLYLTLKKLLKSKQDINFIPHLTLGRVNKDVSQQEYLNIVKDLNVLTKKLKVSDISFSVDSIDLVKSQDGKYSVEMSISSS
ncbi:TPA: hypothetical protein GX533_00905 [Candidatus Dojkabacteria bacterium]|uniref:RNA 2',3'-cyclic phosphodiesterase n=1 Tax=Candidatus Dojkabacteria bacterium TaxID=2099670 RepID=A0A832QC01_9BACT|nr:2'-5' RNA ligase family protein [Candidatus Dojkabacteria bacterium]HHX99230.1 hypothetical protein [Candidatus Dojkabacteria bacterium]